jgi:threonine aldolase
MTNDVGIDVLSFDGTKNGLLFGSTVIFFKSNLANDFMYIQKQGMHFPSDVRFIATQFNTMISNNLWYRNADNANRMAKLLESKVQDIPQINITQKVESNGIWATVPKKYIPVLQAEYPFYVWNEQANEVCWMTSFNTTEEDVEKFADFIRRAVK